MTKHEFDTIMYTVLIFILLLMANITVIARFDGAWYSFLMLLPFNTVVIQLAKRIMCK